MKFAASVLAFYGPLCALTGFLFWTNHTTAGAWCIVVLAVASVEVKSDGGKA